MRLFALIFSAVAFMVTSVQAQGIPANCGINAFPTGGCVTPSEGSASGEQAYFGLQLVFGSEKGLTPKVVAGIRTTDVSDDGRTTGADLAIRFAPGEGGFVLDSVVISGLYGEDEFVGRFGAGYSYTHAAWLGSGAIERGIVGVGVDYAWSAGVAEYFAEVSARSERLGSGISCPAGFTPRDIDVEDPFNGDEDDFFVLSPDLLVGTTTCEPDEFGFNGPDLDIG